MTTVWTLNIVIDSNSYNDLRNSGYALYLLRGVTFGPTPSPARSAMLGGGSPLVWQKPSYLPNTSLVFDDSVYAYVSKTEVIKNAVITLFGSTPAGPNTLVTVNNNGPLTATTSQQPGVVIDNAGTTQWTTGLASSPSQTPTPYCAFPLYGQSQLFITPQPRFLMLFAPDTPDPALGAPVTLAWNPGLYVDFNDAVSRTVSYNINTGWDAQSATWATAVSANQDIGSLLIAPQF